MKISQILDKIDENQLFVPAFQREYVWKRKNVKQLMDSLIRDYPTGTMLTWETNQPPELKGDWKYHPEQGAVKLILDGQANFPYFWHHVWCYIDLLTNRGASRLCDEGVENEHLTFSGSNPASSFSTGIGPPSDVDSGLDRAKHARGGDPVRRTSAIQAPFKPPASSSSGLTWPVVST